MASKDKRNWKPWQAKRRDETFSPITNSMRKSSALRTLNAKQIALLFLCWIQGNPNARGKAHLPRDDFPHVDKYRHDNVFYMCRNKAVLDGIYEEENRKYYTDMKALEKHGFIDRLERGHKGKPSVYILSSRWQNYK